MTRTALVGAGIGIIVGLVVGIVVGVVSGIFGGAVTWGSFEAIGGDIEAVFYLTIAGAVAGALVGVVPGSIVGSMLGAMVGGTLQKKKVNILNMIVWVFIAISVGALVGAIIGLLSNEMKVFPVTSRQISSEASQAIVWGGTGILGGAISGVVLGGIAAIVKWLAKYSSQKW